MRVRAGSAVVLILVAIGVPSASTSSAGASTAAKYSHINCPSRDVPGGPTGCYLISPGIHKIKHVIIIMQENRSFDSYFGTYPGTDGIPMKNGTPTVCVPDQKTGECVAPFHDVYDVNGGGPHSESHAIMDVNHGRMNGFIKALRSAQANCTAPDDPACNPKGQGGNASQPDVMGYHTAAEIPNYWTYAKDFVLNDHMFEPVKSWSLPEHEFEVSGWAARCGNKRPSSCKTDAAGSYTQTRFDQAVTQELKTGTTSIDLAWTDLTYLLFRHKVSWGYYVESGAQPDCENDAALTCKPVPQNFQTPGIWNPLPLFSDVQADKQLKNIQPLSHFYRQASAGTLPAVSWVTPAQSDSDHPPAAIHKGQAYVTSLINAVMESSEWDSTAIFLGWDDWGGFYDNVVPPNVDQNGYGLRVPAMTISPYAKQGYIDHQTLSSDAYLRFIEDDFLGGSRLDPVNDGRPDPRPTVRENAPQLGNLASNFNFQQVPRPPVLLPTNPPTDSPSISPEFKGAPPCEGCTTPPDSTLTGS